MAAKPATKTYKVIEPMKHDGESYAPGDGVPLTASQAKLLQASNVVGNAVKAKSATPPAE